MIDLLIITSSSTTFMIDYAEKIDQETFHRSSLLGRLKDGRSFKVVVTNRDWTNQITGSRFRSYALLGMATHQITRPELQIVQSRMIQNG